MSSVKQTTMDGDVAVGRNLTVGGQSSFKGKGVFDHDLRVKGWLDADNIKGMCKGLYATVEKLNETYPRPMPGWFALVGDTLPADVYRYKDGKWVATGEKGGEFSLDLDEIRSNMGDMQEDLDRIMGDTYPFVITSLTAQPSLAEVGKAFSVKFDWGYKNLDFHPLASQTLDGETVSKGTLSVTKNLPAQSERKALAFTLQATSTDKLTANKSVSVQVNHLSYHGVAAAGVSSLDAAAIKGGAKSLNWGRDKSIQFTQDNQKVWYAYPKYFGDLTSVKNSSGFEGLSGYVKSTVQVDGVDYLLYLQHDAATASDTYSFK